MRHRKAGNPLGRSTSHRRALMRNMVTSLFRHEQIETTDAKAKALRPVAEKLITLAKRGDLHARRQAMAYLQEKGTTHRLFEGVKDRYFDRQGGYLRIVKKGRRKGDGAPISVVQLLPGEEGKKKTPKAKGKKPRAERGSGGKAKEVKSEKRREAEKRAAKDTGTEVGGEPGGREEVQAGEPGASDSGGKD